MKKLFLSMLMMAVTAGARIEWKQTEVTLPVHPTQISAEAVFEFTNAGDQPVSFSNIEITCGCLVAKPLKSSYAPGEKGQLIIMLNMRNRYGKQHKIVFAHTLDGQRSELMVSADIPRAFTLKSPLVNWRKGDDSPEKRVTLRNPNAIPIKLLSVTSSSEFLPAELKTIREGFEYEVVVLRNPAAVNARAVIRVRTEPPPGLTESKVIKLYVSAR
jgi:hypothetical protein